MTAADHLATARRQLDGADRRLDDGRTKDADGCLAGLIAEASKARLQIAYDRGRDDERADHETQASLDGHVRVMRGRDAIVAALVRDLGWRRDVALERANNYAQALSGGAASTAGMLEMVGKSTTPDRRMQVLAHVLSAWARSEFAGEETDGEDAGELDELADADPDAEGPCRAGDESRCPEHTESLESTAPPAPVSPTTADLARLGALCTGAVAGTNDECSCFSAPEPRGDAA